ncbi:MAG TPA: DUF4908 domain-containing protein [Rhizomicrobium sp.]|jgi:hypothetical protein
MIRSSFGAFAAFLFLLCVRVAQAGQGTIAVEARLSSDRLGHIEAGRYLAGDSVGFLLADDGPDYLLQFDGSPEIFVLHANSAALGGHVLQYDSGETALQVSGWGGVTLYTDSYPAGLPAIRTGDTNTPAPPVATVADVQNAAEEDTQHWAFAQRLNLAVSADWNAIADDAAACTVALQAMDNVARGLDRFESSAPAHRAQMRRVSQISLEMAGRPAVALNGKRLIVTFDPSRGYDGRASSRAIAQALRALLSIPQKPS